MKKILRYLMAILVIALSFMTNMSTNILAEESHQFSLNVYDWDPTANDWYGDGTEEEYQNNSDIDPGKVFQVDLHYKPGTTKGVGLTAVLHYDSSLVEPIYDGDLIYLEKSTKTIDSGGMWPVSGTQNKDPDCRRNCEKISVTDWTIQANKAPNYDDIIFLIQDPDNNHPLAGEGVLSTMYFKVKDDAPAGSIINFSYHTTVAAGRSYTAVADASAKKQPLTTSGITLNVAGGGGSLSSNTALATLTVKNENQNYPLTPTFVSGSTTVKDYNAVVPYSASKVTIDATAVDANTLIAGGNREYNINVGNNSPISIISQAENGDQEIYTITVYRLNNDANLSSLSLTNNINVGTISDDTNTYTALVPYSTSITSVNATTRDSNAEIISGTGSWSLTNYGPTLNTRDIVVNAENCKREYESVPGNSCTNKTYTIEITRTAPSSNANLSDLKVNGVTVSGFNSTRQNYDLENVPYETSSIDLNAMVEDVGKATIISSLGTKQLSVGPNSFIVSVRAEDGSPKEYTINVRRLSNNSKLSSLTVTSDPMGTLNPEFNKEMDTYTYTAPPTVSTVTVNATVDDTENATIISGPENYNIDTTSSVKIIVQAEDGTHSTYIVNLVRTKSSNNNLGSLSVDGYDLNEPFSPENKNYTVDVSGEVDSINISAAVADTGKATIISGTGEHELGVGENKFTVKVKAENGEIKDYFITVNRAKKTVSALTDLKVDGVTVPDFSEENLEYTLPNVVPFEKNSVNITATLKDEDSTIEGDGVNTLETGLNKLYVKVTAQDGTTKTTYIINIEREKDSNALLSDLKVDGQTIEGFEKTTFDGYSLIVENNVTSLNLEPITESQAAEYTITGNSDFITTDENIVIITIIAESGNLQTYKIHVIRKKSDNNYLTEIILSNGQLNEEFHKLTKDYTVDVDRDVTTIDITATVEDPSSEYAVSGPSTLVIGDNRFTITVTSELGNDNVYNVVVNRNPSSNNLLSELKVDGELIPGFDKNEEDYTINVPSTKNSIVLSGMTEEAHATTNGFKTYNLETGRNEFEIIVTAENGEPKTYTVVVIKEKSNNSALSDLSIAQTTINPTFSPDETGYTASVEYSVTNIDIVATPSDSKAQIEGAGNKSLTTGENPFEINVTAEDGTKTTYTIVVTRAKNNNANLSNITLSNGYELNKEFDPEVIEGYSVSVPNEIDSITITPFTQDANAVASIENVETDGSIALITGTNTINIKVTAEDGTTTKTYTITINRAKNSDATLKSLNITGGTLKPEFSPTEDRYEIIVPYEIDKLIAEAIPNANTSDVSYDEDLSLEVGTNTKTITVTAEDGTVGIYTITITRQPSANNFLSSLSVKDLAGNEYINNFSATETTPYEITVENNVDKLIINAIVEDSTATIEDNSNIGEQTVAVGDGNQYKVYVTSDSGITRSYTINVTRKANSNNFLSKLEIEGQTITPEFNKTVNNGYTLNVSADITKIKVIAEPEINTSAVVISRASETGEVDLVTGENTITVTVTAENGDENTYTIIINKAASNNNYLSSLSVTPGELTPVFNKEEENYEVHVDNGTNMLTISAEKEHSAAEIIEGVGIVSVNVGEQTYSVKVKAENNEIKTYRIKVIRDASSVKDLKSITINGELIKDFNKDTKKYEIDVDNLVDRVEIGAEVVDITSQIITKLGEIELSTGKNTITITVQAEDGTLEDYTIYINRAKSNNNYLSSLMLNEGKYSPEFNKEETKYYITVPYEVTSLDLTENINFVKEDSAATIEIQNNANFEVGINTVTINVIAENSDVRPYKIEVTRQEKVDNFLTSIEVLDNNGVKYPLDPEFDKTKGNYDVELPNSIDEVNINVTKQSDDLIVRNDGKVIITSLPQTHEIVVSTKGGTERTYTLNFVRGLSSNKDLASLNVTPGILTPSFNNDELTYNVKLPEGSKEITIDARKQEDSQRITGDGKQSLKPGLNTFKITVTAENGDFKVYTINVEVEDNNTDNVLSSISVDKGTLSPEFNRDTKLYTVDLDEDEESITISATGKNNITGDGLKNLDPGANVFEIISTDKDGNENTYRVVVNRGNIVSPYLKYLAIDNYKLNEPFNRENYSYSLDIYENINKLDVIAIPEDKNASVSITGNTNMTYGENNIVITVTDSESNIKEYNIKVNIGNNRITSSIHTVGDKYIATIPELNESSKIKSEMDNPIEYLKIYDQEGNEVLDDDIVGTGFTINLVIDGKVLDSKVLVVMGDVNGDGKVGVSDITMIRSYILEISTLNEYESLSSDVNEDGKVGVSDITMIRGHILEISNLFSKEVE